MAQNELGAEDFGFKSTPSENTNFFYCSADEQIKLAIEYFRNVDACHARLPRMFTDDVQVYFPKFGTAYGKAEFMRLIEAVSASVFRFFHEEKSMIFTQAGHRLVVEGLESGSLVDGTPFPANSRSEGRYCNVFEFRGALISRLHIYADPDLAGQHDTL